MSDKVTPKAGYQDGNPKTILGLAKPSLTKIPPAALLYLARAMSNGATKYGKLNWREKDVTTSIYIDACFRHLLAYMDGEEWADDSGIEHIAHAMASLAIIADAKENGNLIDDRLFPGPAARLIKEYTTGLK